MLEYGLVPLMTNALRVLGWITRKAQFSGRDAKCGTDFNMSRSNNHSQGLDHHVKKGKRGACRQKAATVLPDRTVAT